MNPPVESVRISAQGRDQLIKLKRQTGIENWNVLCRWALCCSLREKTPPPRPPVVVDGGVEMSWRVFAGDSSEILAALIYQRARLEGCNETADGPGVCLRAHVHRGLGYLASGKELRGISGFLNRWLHNRQSEQEGRS